MTAFMLLKASHAALCLPCCTLVPMLRSPLLAALPLPCCRGGVRTPEGYLSPAVFQPLPRHLLSTLGGGGGGGLGGASGPGLAASLPTTAAELGAVGGQHSSYFKLLHRCGAGASGFGKGFLGVDGTDMGWGGGAGVVGNTEAQQLLQAVAQVQVWSGRGCGT